MLVAEDRGPALPARIWTHSGHEFAMETITLEVRPRLRSCNVFISTRNPIEHDSIQLKLNERSITLRIGNVAKHLRLSSVKIVPKTLSLLRVSDNWISFRLQTEPGESTFGSFRTELVSTSDTQNGYGNGSLQTHDRVKQRECTVCCSRCKKEMTKVVSFERVLPLPGNDCDPSEWFCCKHDENDYSKLLSPRESDCFYGNSYRLLNRAVFKPGLKINGSAVSCDRCLTVVGTLWKDDVSMRVWNCCVEYKLAKEAALADKASDPLSDFALVVRDSTDGITGSKVLLEALLDSSRSHYLLLQLMDQRLDLLVGSGSPCSDSIRLEPTRVAKVLYRYGETEMELVESCEEVQRCQVALPVVLAGVDHLLLTTKRIPPAYRVADKYCVGYIDLQNS